MKKLTVDLSCVINLKLELLVTGWLRRFFFYLICILSCLIDRVSDYREMVCMTDYARRFFPYLYPNLQHFVFNCYIILLAAFFQSQMETKSHTKKYSFWITVNDNRTGKFTVKFQKIIWFFKIKYICLA